MNRVCLIGRLTSKPELRYTPTSNVPTTRFNLAVNRPIPNSQGQKETDFISVLVWRKQAENVCQYLDKGSLVAIEGRIQTGSYNDKDGNKRYSTDIVAENVQFLESKSKDDKSSEVKPSDFEEHKIDNDPFADFGDKLVIEDNFLE